MGQTDRQTDERMNGRPRCVIKVHFHGPACMLIPFYQETLNGAPNPFPSVAFSSVLNTAGEVSLLLKSKTV